MVVSPEINPRPAAPKGSTLTRLEELRTVVVRHTVREVVADKVATLIASGMLRVGDVLPSERDLAGALQVSRVTVRGALQALEARGIIAVSHGVRSRVIRADVGSVRTGIREQRLINSYDMDAVHAARLIVEMRVVADAATRMNGSTLALLRTALTTQKASLTDPVSFLISDREFHLTIYGRCGNPVLADFVGDLYSYMMEHRRKAVSRPEAIRQSVADHAAILAGLEAEDPDEVARAFEVHIERIYRTTRTVMAVADGDPTDPPARSS
jgi:DNA-binding FadR family transcriptional regulator